MTQMTPPEIVSELDKHIVGQDRAKKAVAIALRNRWRRAQVEEPLRSEITPKNILMIGPTGVGKTEIARRLARLANAPFIKIEATKFTEVGYVGRDVDTIVRDLMEIAIKDGRERAMKSVRDRALDAAEDRVLDALLPPARPVGTRRGPDGGGSPAPSRSRRRTRGFGPGRLGPSRGSLPPAVSRRDHVGAPTSRPSAAPSRGRSVRAFTEPTRCGAGSILPGTGAVADRCRGIASCRLSADDVSDLPRGGRTGVAPCGRTRRERVQPVGALAKGGARHLAVHAFDRAGVHAPERSGG